MSRSSRNGLKLLAERAQPGVCLLPVLLVMLVVIVATKVKDSADIEQTHVKVTVEFVERCADASTSAASVLQLLRPGSSLQTSAKDLAARLRWIGATTIYFLVAIGTFIVGSRTLILHSGKRDWCWIGSIVLAFATIIGLYVINLESHAVVLPERIDQWVLTLAIAMLVILLAATFWKMDTLCGASVAVAGALFLWIVTKLPIEAWIRGNRPEESGARVLTLLVPMIDRAVSLVIHETMVAFAGFDRLLGGVAILSASLLGLAASAIIADSQSRDGAADIRKQLSSARMLLYSGAALLVMGIIAIKSLQAWPRAFACESDAKDDLKAIEEEWALLLGSYWSLLLAAIYWPVVVVLDRQARALAAAESANTSPAKIESWLKEQELSAAPAQQIVRAATLLGPWLAGGPLSQIVSLITT